MSQKSVNGSYWQTPLGARNQILLIPISLEERIPDDHPVRLLDEILDGLDWTAWESQYSGKLGQPPIHPSIPCKVLLFAMIRRVRSSRIIEDQIEHSVDFMWLVSGRSIDHSTISDFRRQHKKELKDIHRQMLRVAIDMGVAKLSELCIDGTRVRANASRHKTWTADRVEKLLKELDGQIDTAMAELETNDSIDEIFDDGTSPAKLPPELAELTTRREKMNEVLEQLQEMDRRRKADGINPKKNPAQLPKSDLDGRVLPNKEGGYAPTFTPLAVHEMTNGFIVEADVLIGNVEHLNVITTVDAIVCVRCRGRLFSLSGREDSVSRRSGDASNSGWPGVACHLLGEMPFAVMKVCFDMRRFLLRGLAGVQAEWQWCCTAFNLKKLMNLIAALRAEQRETAKNEI